MYYKGMEVDPSRINKTWTLSDIPDSSLGEYLDVIPRKPNESSITYRQRIVEYLNVMRQKIVSGIASRTHNSDKSELRSTNYNANPGQGLFKTRNSQDSEDMFLRPQRKGITYKSLPPREFTTLDIETDDRGNPITVSALKQVFNRSTGQFETVDNYQRFYHAKNTDLKESSQIHGLTSAKLKRLRSQQAQYNNNRGYSKSYNAFEAEQLKNFLGNSIIIGHNVVDFDLPHLFKSPINNQVIDTLTASRNQWKNKKNDLDSVFKRLFGKTMEQAGLSHHDSMSDVIATSLIMQRMALLKSKTGDSLRYVMTHGNVHLAPEDEYIGSQLITGTYDKYHDLGRYITMDDYVKIEDIIDKKKLGGKYNEDTKSYDLPEGMHYVEEGGFEDTELMAQSLAEVAQALRNEIKKAGTISQEAKEAYTLGNMSRTQQTIRSLSYFDNEADMRAELANSYGITNRDTQDVWIKRALDRRERIKNQKAKNSVGTSLEKAIWKAEYEGREEDLEELKAVDDSYTPQEIWNVLHNISDREKEQARKARVTERIDAQNERFKNYKDYALRHLDRHYDIGDWRDEFKATTDKSEFDEVLDEMKVAKAREKKIRQLEKNGVLTKSDRAALDAAPSMEDFNNIADDVADRMGRINQAFSTFAKIPIYNFERLEAAFKGEVGGIKGAARGVVPNLLYSPLSRLTDASLNAMTGHYANLKYGLRAGSAIGGGLFSAGAALAGAGSAAGGIGAIPGLVMMGIGGTIGAISQIAGNAGESKIVKWGEGIQNNLNTLGFLQDMILMPFRLLKIAIDGVLKGLKLFAGVLKSIAGIMSSGMGTLTGMGNPITGMTGVGYGDYVGLNSIDAASLLGKGTVNNIMNDFARQRIKLYTTGQLDTSRLVAASMLGIFDEVYGYKANDEEAFSEALNRIHNNMKGMDKMSKKTMFGLAMEVNPNIAEILQTMDTLGVNDINELKHPKNMWGYSSDSLDKYRSMMQRTQWEYNYGNSQADITKGRIATSLWNGPMGFSISGRSLTNSFNRVMKSIADALETGNWESVGNTISEVWKTIKEGADDIWVSIKKAFGIESTASFGEYLKETVMGWGDSIADILKNKVLPVINNLWDQITDIIIDKFTGVASYLSTIHIDWKEFYKQVVQGKESNKPWITSLGDNKYTVSNDEGKLIYDKFIGISQAYDRKYGINNLWETHAGRGKQIAGIPTHAYNKNALQTWLSSTLKSGTPEQIEYLNKLIEAAGVAEAPRLQPGQDGVEFLDWIIQHDIKPAGANTLHDNKWGDIQSDRDKDPLNIGVNKIVNEYRALREPISNSVIGAVGDTVNALMGIQVQDPALLRVQFRDDKGNAFAGAEVKMSGKVDTHTYNGFVDLESKDGVFNFQVSQQMRGTR